MTNIYLFDHKIERPAQIFVPSVSEMNLIFFLNQLPIHSCTYIPDDNRLVLDFEILRQNQNEIMDLEQEIKIIYQEKEYSCQEFLKLFTEEKTFFV